MKSSGIFKSVSEMVNWLLDNETTVLRDSYGREWKYEEYKFYFKDLSDEDFKEGLSCLHLFGTI